MPPAGHAAAMRSLKALADAFFLPDPGPDAPTHAQQGLANGSGASQPNNNTTKLQAKAAQELEVRVASGTGTSAGDARTEPRAVLSAARGSLARAMQLKEQRTSEALATQQSSSTGDGKNSSAAGVESTEGESSKSDGAKNKRRGAASTEVDSAAALGKSPKRVLEERALLLRTEAHLRDLAIRCEAVGRHLASSLPQKRVEANDSLAGSNFAVVNSATGATPAEFLPALTAAATATTAADGGYPQQAPAATDAENLKRKRESGTNASAGDDEGPGPLKQARTDESAAGGARGKARNPSPTASIRKNASTLSTPLARGAMIAARVGPGGGAKASSTSGRARTSGGRNRNSRSGAASGRAKGGKDGSRGSTRRGTAGTAGRASRSRGANEVEEDSEGNDFEGDEDEESADPDAQDGGDGDAEWILATVLRYVGGDYEIEDVDEAPGSSASPGSTSGSRKRYTLAPRNVVPLPVFVGGSVKLASNWYEECRINGRVWAVFPQTTSFYKGVLVATPSSNTRQPDSYIVKFADDEDEYGQTPERHVHAQFVFAA